VAQWEDLWVRLAPVIEPLLSVSDLVQLDNAIHFDSVDSWIQNKVTGEISTLTQDDPTQYWYLGVKDLVRCMPSYHKRQKEKRTLNGSEDDSSKAFRASALSMEKMGDAIVVSTHRMNTIRNRVINLHERMGHVPIQRMVWNLEGESPAWVNCNVTPEQIRRVMYDYECLICTLAKTKRRPLPFREHGRRETLKVGEILSVDPVGKVPTVSLWRILLSIQRCQVRVSDCCDHG